MKKCWLGSSCLFIFLLLCSSVAFAFGSIDQAVYVLQRGETHHGDLAINAEKAVIEGTVEGDVYVFAQSLEVSGLIKGDVITFSADTQISGTVDGNVRAFTHRAFLSGTVMRNVTVSTTHLTVAEQGEVHGSILAFAEYVDVLGKVNREVNGLIHNLRITGQVREGTSLVATAQLEVDSTAVIGKDLIYTSEQKALIEPGAKIAGTEKFTQKLIDTKGIGNFFSLMLLATSLLSTIILWLVIRYFLPTAFVCTHQQMQKQFGKLFGSGALLFIGIPILATILLFTIVGIPVSLILFISFGIVLYVAKIFVGTWIGPKVMDHFGWRVHPLLAELAGILGIFLALQIPVLGWIICLFMWILFLGALFASIRKMNSVVL